MKKETVSPSHPYYAKAWRIVVFPLSREASGCLHGSEWTTFSEVLSETGVIHNATACIFAAGVIRTLLELHGTTEIRSYIPTLYLSDVTPMLSIHEETKLQEIIPPGVGEVDAIKTRLATPPKLLDVDTLLNIRQAKLRQADHTHS